MSALRDKIRRLIHIRTEFLCRLGAGLIVCLIFWALYTFVGNKLLRPIARRRIEQMTKAAVEIGSIDFKSTGFVRMNYLVIGEPKIQPYESKILRANKVDVHFSLASIFRQYEHHAMEPRLARYSKIFRTAAWITNYRSGKRHGEIKQGGKRPG